MDANLINPFVDSFTSVLPQFGFNDIKKTGLTLANKTVSSNGMIITLGVVGDIKGTIGYSSDLESAKKIASKMMMGMPIESFDDMTQSALCELSNMLTANASTLLSNSDVNVNISTPTLVYGTDIHVQMNSQKILCVDLVVDEIPLTLHISIE